jgi:hypothetical protein
LQIAILVKKTAPFKRKLFITLFLRNRFSSKGNIAVSGAEEPEGTGGEDRRKPAEQRKNRGSTQGDERKMKTGN